ncbi:hypothetical protein Tco_1554807 [Tanacetum coccineum]
MSETISPYPRATSRNTRNHNRPVTSSRNDGNPNRVEDFFQTDNINNMGEKVKETFTRLKILLNELENKGVKIPQAEFNATFVNSLPKKWLSMNQTQRANNSIKNGSLATLFGKYNYEYESETQRFTIQSSTSKALISNTCIQDSDLDVEEDTRSNSEFLADLNVKFHYRALLANLKRFYKSSGIIRGKCKALKAKFAILTKKIDAMSKNKSEKGRGKRKETSSSKEVLFTKSENSSSKIAPEITSNTESDCDNQEPLPPLAKLSWAKPNGT